MTSTSSLHPDDVGSSVWNTPQTALLPAVKKALSTATDTANEAIDYLGPDTVADYTHLKRCDQFYKYEVEQTAPRSDHDRNDFDFGMSPVMAKDGEDFERAVAAFLKDEFPLTIDLVSQRADADDIITAYTDEFGYDHNDVTRAVERAQDDKEVIETNRALDYFFTRVHEVAGNPDATPVVFEQLRIGGMIGVWPLAGVADLVFVWGTENGVRIHVIDLKSSHEEKPRHQIQVACYTTLFRQWLCQIDAADRFNLEAQVTGGILHRDIDLRTQLKDEFDKLGADDHDLPEFDLQAPELDVEFLLEENGDLHELAQTADDEVTYQLDQKCIECQYSDLCYTHAIETQSTALLGLTSSLQETIADPDTGHGIESIHPFAEFARYKLDDRDPMDFEGIYPNPERGDEIRDLKQTSGIGGQLGQLIEQSQTLLGELNPSHDRAVVPSGTPWHNGCGLPHLPSDNPDIPFDVGYNPETLIRIYLHIQYDHRFDRVPMVSAYITARDYDGAETITKIVEEIPDRYAEDKTKFEQLEEERPLYNDYERNMLTRFLTGDTTTAVDGDHDGLFDKIRQIAAAMGCENEAPLHFYFYSPDEEDALVEATERHANDTDAIGAFRDLLAQRNPIDQAITSTIQPEVQSCLTLPITQHGLLPVSEYLYGNNTDYVSSWTYTDENGDAIDLRQDVFWHDLFDYNRPYERRDSGPRFQLANDTSDTGATDDGEHETDWYPLRVRSGAQIPLAYLWGACREMNGEDWEDYIEERGEDGSLKPLRHYLYRDNEEDPVTRRDLVELGKRLATTVAQVERAFDERNPFLTKNPLPLDNLDSFTLGDPSFADAAKEFLQMEYDANRSDTQRHYQKRPWQRVQSGQSLIVHVDEVYTDTGSDLGATVTASVPYDKLDRYADATDPQRIIEKNRFKSQSNDSSGDWLIANPVEFDGGVTHALPNRFADDDTDYSAPHEVERGVSATIDWVSLGNDDRDDDRVQFSVMNLGFPPWAPSDDDFECRHRHWTEHETDVDREHPKWYVPIQPGDYLILDPQTDDVNASRASDLLDDQNQLCRLFDDMQMGTALEPTTDAFNDAIVEAFTTFLSDEGDVDADDRPAPPNEKQRTYIERTDAQISVLQGPPGTGKTSGALANAVLSRAYARITQGRQFAGVVTGPSHRSITEALEDTVDAYHLFHNAASDHPAVDENGLRDTLLVRITNHIPKDEDAEEGVAYVNYSNPGGCKIVGDPPVDVDETVLLHEVYDRLLHRYRTHADPTTETKSDADGQRTIGAYEQTQSSEMNSADANIIVFATPTAIYGLLDRIDDDTDIEDWLDHDATFFDVIASDEASMLQTPYLCIPGAFMCDHTQLLVGGDQRQMPPVLQHEWVEETRRTLVERVPYLSTLNFCRVLDADEEVTDVDEEDLGFTPDADITITRLEQTYRCHADVTAFLRRFIYEKLDGIDYTSSENDTIAPTDPATDALAAVLGEKSPLVLVTHTGDTDRQANPNETAIAHAALDGLNDEDALGVVAPHNAQRAMMERTLSGLRPLDDSADGDPEPVKADTVERFQGGEQDAIIVSATASDPDYLAEQSDFILSPRRLNVAMSRMEKKLVVMASENVFKLIPRDLDEYENAQLWKGLYEYVGGRTGPDETALLEELLGDAAPRSRYNGNLEINVYTFDEDSTPP